MYKGNLIKKVSERFHLFLSSLRIITKMGNKITELIIQSAAKLLPNQ